MATFKVEWEMELEAKDALDAARLARQIHLDTSSLATYFDVTNLETDEITAQIDGQN